MNRLEGNRFDRQLQEKFENFTPEVSGRLWDNIIRELEGHAETVPLKRHRHKGWWMSAAAAALLVSAITYWYNRPVEVTYLHGRAVEIPEEPPVGAVQPETPEYSQGPAEEQQADAPVARRLRRAQASQLVAYTVEGPEVGATDETMPAPVERIDTAGEPRLADAIVLRPEADVLPATVTLAHVPEIQPLVDRDEGDVLLASTEREKRSLGLSTILNYVVSTVDQREEKLVTFSNDGEGSLKLDFNFGLAKNRKKIDRKSN